MEFDTREARVEGRGRDVAHAQGSGADEHDPAGELAGAHPAGQHVGRRHVWKGATGPAEAKEGLTSGVERQHAAAEAQSLAAVGRRLQDQGLRRGEVDGGHRQGRVGPAAEFDEHRQPSQDPIGIGRGVDGTRSLGRPRQRVDAAHGPGAREEA